MPRCPSCDARLDADAVLCIDCCYHLEQGKRLLTKSKRASITIGTNPLSPTRLGIAIGCGAAGLVFCLVGFLLGSRLSEGAVVVFLLLGGLLMVVVPSLGTGQRWLVTKSRKGHPLLSREYWFCFIPIPTTNLSLRNYDACYFDHQVVSNGDSDQDYFYLYLGKIGTDKRLLLYSGGDETRMHELGDALKEIAGLRWERM
jgi:hypothetical protein